MKSALFTAMFGLSLAFATPALASDAPPTPPPPPGAEGGPGGDDDPGEAFMANFSEISQKLGLSTDQQSKIKDMFYKASRQTIDLKANVQKTELDLRQALSQDTIDDKAVMKALDAHLDADATFKRARIQELLDLHKIVTADQWKQLIEMRNQRRSERRAERHGDDDDR